MTEPQVVTIAEPTNRTPNVWRVMHHRQMVARLFPINGDRWEIQRVGEARRQEEFFTEKEAIEAAGYRLEGTPVEEAARRLNHAAEYHDAGEEGTLPCIEIGGAQVYVYIDALGRFRVSIDTEGSDLPVREDGTTPVLICMNEGVIYDDTDEKSLPCEDDRGSILDTYEFTDQFVDRFVKEHPHDYGDYSDVQ